MRKYSHHGENNYIPLGVSVIHRSIMISTPVANKLQPAFVHSRHCFLVLVFQL